MIKIRTCLAGLALAGMASAAYADFSYTPALVSDYDFRGTTQTAHDPAFQLEVDYYSGPLHIGAWTSNLHFDPTDTGYTFYWSKNTELYLLADYSGGSDETFKYTFGLADYTYPGQNYYDFYELYGTLTKAWASVTLHYSPDFFGLAAAGPSSAEAYYIEFNGNYALGDTGFGITGHFGHSWGDYWDNYSGNYANPGDSGSYEDYSVGVTKSFGHFNTALKYIATSNYFDFGGLDKKPYNGAPNDDVFSGAGRVVFSVTTTLPWAKE